MVKRLIVMLVLSLVLLGLTPETVDSLGASIGFFAAQAPAPGL